LKAPKVFLEVPLDWGAKNLKAAKESQKLRALKVL